MARIKEQILKGYCFMMVHISKYVDYPYLYGTVIRSRVAITTQQCWTTFMQIEYWGFRNMTSPH